MSQAKARVFDSLFLIPGPGSVSKILTLWLANVSRGDKARIQLSSFISNLRTKSVVVDGSIIPVLVSTATTGKT